MIGEGCAVLKHVDMFFATHAFDKYRVQIASAQFVESVLLLRIL